MKLVKAGQNHINTMMKWFQNEKETQDWGGPHFRYPYDRQSFQEDIQLDELESYVLISDQGELQAFGQFYLRLGRCHLGRLVVNPEQRGKGLVAILIKHLSDLGMAELHATENSLFVYDHNVSARKAYEKFGFRVMEYPEHLPLEHCLYMMK
ncbi:GNAT family N-acetyltransferase [Vibrio salinus]|uniref:GNAT family N-acetyltransferase n=1 Tax=Vibrio salinus TaxID=2899784 RepID=UPI001E5F2EAE|nr:GNAT family N-acetyltransferase [Vibrio salinus]MCE0495613.1 GNAT family N-acetyltransferase [Vibrio salinus]